jgi:hypothetical protein
LSRFVVSAIVLVLIGGAAVAFTATERLKLEKSPITAPRFDRRFSPVCDCTTDTANLRLRFRENARVDVTIVDTRGKDVRTLATNERIAKGNHNFVWDGRDDAGQVVSDGVYRLRLHLDGSGRRIVVPTTIRVDTAPPNVTLLAVRPEAFSPEGGTAKPYAKLTYRSSEKGQPEILVGSEAALRGRVRGKGRASINWKGTVDGMVVEPGTYDVGIRVRDLAGNLSDPTRLVPVEVKP